jgi:hypothetical protein
MKKAFHLSGIIDLSGAILLFVSLAAAVEPNFVRTTVYGVGQNGTANIVATDYSDGLGRSIQSKVKIDDTTDRVSCTFYERVAETITCLWDGLNRMKVR